MIKWICEVGSNHNGSLDRIYKLIDTAKDIGANAIKFQLFRAEQLWSDPETQKKMHRWELPEEYIPEISIYCKKIGIEFGCSVFFLGGVNILYPFVDWYKIGSYELIYLDLIREVATPPWNNETENFSTNKPMILSTGMGTDEEIDKALFETKMWVDCPNITLLHCNSCYPGMPKDCDLERIEHLKIFYDDYTIGWSDHTRHPGVIYAAIAHGAEVIEFHMDLDGQGWEYSVGHCWLPSEIKPVIDNVRIGEMAIQSSEQNLEQLRQQRTDVDGMRPLKEIRQDGKII